MEADQQCEIPELVYQAHRPACETPDPEGPKKGDTESQKCRIYTGREGSAGYGRKNAGRRTARVRVCV